MKLLLIVGTANDIYIYNYAKWLKKSMDVTIDVFEFYPSKQQGYGNEYYDNVTSAKCSNIPFMYRYIDSCVMSYSLKCYLRDKEYDLIHCHWVVSPIVQTKGLKKHCKKLAITFWGGEFERQKILGSVKLYNHQLDVFSKDVDAIINSKESVAFFKDKLPNFAGVTYSASLGSAPLEALFDLMKRDSRDKSKEQLGIPVNKKTVLIGYSGKEIHQHIPIISKLSEYPYLKGKLHLLLPMTRGSYEKYIARVKEELEKSGFSYSLISGRFLSDIEIAKIRNATDITLQLSISDAFSRSIVECFCAKSIVIYGNWLGYDKYLNTSGFEGIGVNSIEEGIGKLSNITDKVDSFSRIVETNHESGKSKYMWSECIRDWVNAYNDLLK